MAATLFLLALSCGAIAVGAGYVRTARRMRSYATGRGKILTRDVIVVPGTVDTREGRWGQGGGYTPAVTYAYTVAGTDYTGDRIGYAYRGYRRSVAEQRLAAIPDEVDVHYDPDEPQKAYLEKHRPRLGLALVTGGTIGAIGALAGLLT
jgi:hypothetical protein